MKKLAIGTFILTMMSSGAIASDLDDAIAKGAVRLLGDELAALYGGHTWTGKTAQGTDFSQKISADGTAVLTFKGKNDAGRWRVDGDKGCASWTKLRNGKEACVAIVRMPDGSYAAFNEDGFLNSTFDVQ